MKRDLKSLGTRVRNARLTKGLSLTDLAEKSKISKGYLSLLENGGDVNPTFDVFLKIAKALDVTLADLLGAPKVQSRPAIIAELPAGLRELLEERRRAGRPLDEETIYGLAHANYRGRKPQSKSDFEFVLQTLARATRQGKSDDDE